MNVYESVLVYMRFSLFMYAFDVFESLVWPTNVPQAFSSPVKKAFFDLWTMSIQEIARIVSISLYTDLGTFLERRVPENHEFWWY